MLIPEPQRPYVTLLIVVVVVVVTVVRRRSGIDCWVRVHGTPMLDGCLTGRTASLHSAGRLVGEVVGRTACFRRLVFLCPSVRPGHEPVGAVYGSFLGTVGSVAHSTLQNSQILFCPQASTPTQADTVQHLFRLTEFAEF